jgi:hypothetical protein
MAVLGGARVPLEWQGDDLFEEDFSEARAALIAADAPKAPPVVGMDGEVVEQPMLILPSKAELTTKRERTVLSEENFEGNVLQSIRAEGWKYIEANAGNPRNLSEKELFDLRVDPAETSNLAGKAGRRQASMSQLMRQEFKAAKELRVEEQKTDLSMADCERMRALGYISGDCSEIVGGQKPVPTGAAPEETK